MEVRRAPRRVSSTLVDLGRHVRLSTRSEHGARGICSSKIATVALLPLPLGVLAHSLLRCMQGVSYYLGIPSWMLLNSKPEDSFQCSL